jgi:hypothetical protein
MTTVLVYLAKLIINKAAEARLEKYKNTLARDTEKFRNGLNFESEKFKHELNTSLTEHQIKYTKLYEERGQIIKLIYNLLLDLENSLSELTTMFQGPDWTIDTERDKNANERIKMLRSQLEVNRIFFSEELCAKLDGILNDSYKITVDMYKAKMAEKANNDSSTRRRFLSPEELVSPLDSWRQLDMKVQTELKAARLNLAQEFRLLIGVK